jgi:two-component system, NarL family, sensor histidine kinase DesK
MNWMPFSLDGGGRRRGRYPLLPDDPYMGWTPYAWLCFLPIFYIEPVYRSLHGTASAGYWTAVLLGTVVFLYTYFRVHWAHGRELVALIGVQLALGVIYAPLNSGASVFIIYAACFAGQIESQRVAVRALFAIPLVSALTAWVVGVPLHFWLTSVFMAPLFGAVLLHFAQAQRASQRLIRAQEEIEHLAKVAERERIARDLHDVLGHTLSLVVLKAELAGKLMTRDPERARREIGDVEHVARTALQDVRNTIRGYRAEVDNEMEHARSLLHAAGIGCAASVRAVIAEPVIEESIALALREATTNVVRHAHATRCTITIDAVADAYILEVADDGCGITAAEGSGLLGMRERVSALRGTVEWSSDPQRGGTLLRVRLPIADGSAGVHRAAAARPADAGGRATDVAARLAEPGFRLTADGVGTEDDAADRVGRGPVLKEAG